MIYKCKKCKKFLAKIEDHKNFEIRKAKNITITDKFIKIRCKCGEITEIKKGAD